MAEKRRAFMAILPCFHAVPTRQVPGTDHLGARANEQPVTDAQARVFISSLSTVILSSAPRSLKPRDFSAGGSRDGRPPPSLPPPPVSARADGRLSRGTASPCAGVCMRARARGWMGILRYAQRCYVTGPGFPLFPSRSAMVRSCTVGFRLFKIDA